MTEGQALINRAKLDRASRDKLEAYQDQQAEWMDNKSKKSGWGRFLGAAALGVTALATGGTSLAIGAAAGLGSRLGSEAGENLADRGNIWGKKGPRGSAGKFKPKKLDKKDINFYKEQAGQINRDTARFERDFDMKQNTDAAKDAYTAYNLANVAQSYGGEAAKEAAAKGGVEGAAEEAAIANQTPLQGLKRAGTDWKTSAGKIFKGKGTKGVVDEGKIISAISGNSDILSAGSKLSSAAQDIVNLGPKANYMDTFELMKNEPVEWIKGTGWVEKGS